MNGVFTPYFFFKSWKLWTPISQATKIVHESFNTLWKRLELSFVQSTETILGDVWEPRHLLSIFLLKQLWWGGWGNAPLPLKVTFIYYYSNLPIQIHLVAWWSLKSCNCWEILQPFVTIILFPAFAITKQPNWGIFPWKLIWC